MSALIDLYKRDHGTLIRWVAKKLGLGNVNPAHPSKLRRDAMAQRVRLYRDNGERDVSAMIDAIFVQDDVKRDRKAMIKVASEQNLSATIVNEVASLYDRPAIRRYTNAAEDARWRDIADEIAIDEVMQEAHRLCFLCNEVLLWSVKPEGAKLDLHIVTPDVFDVIAHPENKLLVAGVLIDAAPAAQPEGDRLLVKQYELWDDTFVYSLNANGEMLQVDGYREHGLGRIPGVVLHRRKPVEELLDCHAGYDIISAHLGVALLEVMVMRLAKSQGERQPVLQGNLAQVAAGQSMNGEKPLLLPPDVVASMLDTKTDAQHYLDMKTDKLASVGQRWGISTAQFMNSDAAEVSGAGFRARRLKLSELRVEQVRRARVHERDVAELLGFDPKLLRVTHPEMAAPADAKEELDILAAKIKMGLSSPIRHLLEADPSLTREEAIQIIRDNARDWGIVIGVLRALNAPANAAQSGDVGKSPQENGAANDNADEEPDGEQLAERAATNPAYA